MRWQAAEMVRKIVSDGRLWRWLVRLCQMAGCGDNLETVRFE